MLFEQQNDLKLLKEYGCATGENPGTKQISGDAKTPVGVYFITEVYEDQKITVFGSRAFHLDYPNIFDTQAGHRGDGIFIHGTNKQLFSNSTNGCITLNNDDLDELAAYLTIEKIPVIVVETLPESFPNKHIGITKDDTQFNEILKGLELDTLRNQTNNIKTLYFIKIGKQAIASVNYDEFDGNFIRFQNQKRSYLVRAQTRDWRTLYAKQGEETILTFLARHPIKYKIASPSISTKKQHDIDPKSELLAFVEKWRNAWQTKDIKTYIDCYAPSFHNGKLNRIGWKARKSYLNRKYSFIRVTIHDINIKWTNSGANVSFHQTYQSNTFQTSGKKTLQLVKHGNRWLIKKELI